MNSETQPLVSIILLNWNGIEDTKICLDHIKHQTYRNFETIVVDNGSTDDSLHHLRKEKNIILVENKINRGFTGGHIDGLKYANGEFILILNNDAVMKPDLIEKAMQSFDDEKVAVVGGRAYFWNKDNKLLDETNLFYSYQFINPISAEAIFYQKDYGVSEEVNNVSGSCAVIRRSVIEKLGYLDDRFFAYYEEADLFARYKRAGHKIIYNPQVRIWHKVGASSNKQSSSFMYYMLFRNRFIFAVHNFESTHLRLFLWNYTKFGIKSLLKSFLKKGDPAINQPFVKAVIYNMFNFPKSFRERKRLNKMLGKSNYNSLINIEQSNYSHIVKIDTVKDLEQCIEASSLLRPSHELLLVSKKDFSLKASQKLPHNVRFIHDKNYFGIREENIGALTARYDWLVFSDVKSLCSKEYHDHINSSISTILVTNKELYAATDSNPTNHSLNSLLNSKIYSPVLVKRQHVLDLYGLPNEEPLGSALLVLTAYCQYIGVAEIQQKKRSGSSFQNSVTSSKIDHYIKYIQSQSFLLRKTSVRFYEPVFKRYYRLQQLRNLVNWLFSRDIQMRLKLARVRNLMKFTFTLNGAALATELKHVRNEVLLSKGTVKDLTSQRALSNQSYDELHSHPEDTPVFIICRDRLSPLIELIGWLEKAGIRKIILIDNDSAYPELLDYLSKTKYQVLDMKRNAGHTVAWQQSIIPIMVPYSYYIVTDPDVIPTFIPSKKSLRYLYEIHNKYKDHLKVGLGLKINDLPDHYSLKESVIKWEGQFWNNKMSPGIFEAGVDTTFALYKPFVYDYLIHPSLRLGEPYTARHLPWYMDDSKLDAEDTFYRLHADQNVNTWNKGELPERYLKELRKIDKKR